MKNSIQKIIAIGMGYVNLVVHNLISFVLTPLMISVWGDGSYGLYKIILSLMTYFMLIDAGIKNSVIRFVSEYRSKNDRDSARKYVTCVFLFYIIASVILTIVVWIFSKYIPVIYAKSLTNDEICVLLKGLPWVLLYTIATLYFNCFTALLRGYNKQVLVQSLNIAKSIVRFIIILVMLKMKYGVVSIIAVDALLAVVFTIFVLGVVFIGLQLPPKLTGITKGFIYGIFSYSGIMLVYTVAHSLFWSIDNFIVGVMTSSVIAAVYSTSVTLTNVFQSLAGAISQVLVPDIMVKGFSTDNAKELDNLMVRVGKLKMYVMLPILLGFGLFGKEFVHLWVGKGYTNTYILAFLIMIPLFFGLLQDVPNNIMLARNKHKVMAIVTLIAAVINVISSCILIQTIGVLGVAIGTVIAYSAVYIVFTYYYYSKELHFDMKRLYVETVLMNLPFIIVLLIVGFLLRMVPIYGWGGLIIRVILFMVAYIIAIGVLSKDKEMVRATMKRAVRKN